VVYFRAGYDPSCYHGHREWEARLLVERSMAIKCPSVHYHLSGTKKVSEIATYVSQWETACTSEPQVHFNKEYPQIDISICIFVS